MNPCWKEKGKTCLSDGPVNICATCGNVIITMDNLKQAIKEVYNE